jgi:hypothetical protein
MTGIDVLIPKYKTLFVGMEDFIKGKIKFDFDNVNPIDHDEYRHMVKTARELFTKVRKNSDMYVYDSTRDFSVFDYSIEIIVRDEDFCGIWLQKSMYVENLFADHKDSDWTICPVTGDDVHYAKVDI